MDRYKLIDHYKDIALHVLVALFVGVIVGALDAVFGRTLLAIGTVRDTYALYLIPLLPLAGLGIVFCYHRCSKESLKGMSLVFMAAHGEKEKIPKMLVPLVMVSTWVTHLFGGSAGREGVAVQIGATVAHTIGRRLNLRDNGRVMLITGMAAGFAGLFQTPLAATFFALEVLVAGALLYEALLPALVAAFVASATSHALGLEKFSFAVKGVDWNSADMIWKVVLLGVLFGMVGGGFAHLLDLVKKWLGARFLNAYKKIFLCGILLAVLLLVFHTGRYSGLGTNLIADSLAGGTIYSYDWLLKILLTVLTLSIGFQGGEVTPLFAIGASLGVVAAGFLGLSPVVVASLGYIAVFGSATNTLFAPILIGAEVFGSQNLPLYVAVCAIAYVCNGNRSIYTAQKTNEFFVGNEEL